MRGVAVTGRLTSGLHVRGCVCAAAVCRPTTSRRAPPPPLASFPPPQGYVVVAYDRRETALQPLSDADCVMVIRGLMDWVGGQVDVVAVANPRKALLVGHSRGARLSVLAATQDTRVKGLALIDPVDFSYEQRPGPE